MPKTFYYYEPCHGHGLAHDPFKAIIGPRPIGWIATCNPAGNLNLAPYSFFNAFNSEPPIIGFASTGYKDTLGNIEKTGEFTWNLATRSLAEAMNQTSQTVPPEIDEFKLASLTPTASRLIKAPRVAESPVSFECRKTQIVQLSGANGSQLQTWLILGEVIAVHIDHEYLHDGVYNTGTAGHILRGGGPADYFAISPDQQFQMRRPK